MATYKTPGVYVEELSVLPPSVAGVGTAVPAFIGYTEKAPTDSAVNIKRIKSFLEFEQKFGGAPTSTFAVTKASDVISVTSSPELTYQMYYALKLYFANGGGPCYVVSAGLYNATPAIVKADLEAGLDALRTEDEPTLIILTDAVSLSTPADYYDLCQGALLQCSELKDRFCIFDVNDPEAFRAGIGNNHLKYGAAYYPYLQTSLNFVYAEGDVTLTGDLSGTLDALDHATADYNDVKSAIDGVRVIMPPSSAMAGIYASVDRDSGVWKAPANYGLASVTAPVVKITQADQESLNIDATAGKSINAIRTFYGKGVLVWGGRTLAGNDNEWRYISVRRLFNYIEESVQKATAFIVFEPNSPMSWLKVKTMISVFLEGLWKQGALAGTSPEQAFFVNVGLDKTMTEEEVLAGIMNIEIGIAAVRPAEFVILKFSHKLQNS
jgi:hypothetical protein